MDDSDGTGGKRPLRVGLLLNSLTVPAWVERMLDRIDESAAADVALLVIRVEPEPPPSPKPDLGARIRGVLMRVYDRLDSAPPPSAFAARDIAGRYADVPRVDARVKTGTWTDRISVADVEAIRGHNLDVLIRIGFRILRGKIFDAAKFGVWSYHHGNSRYNRGGPAGFWEVFEGESTTGSMLQILSDRLDDGAVLATTLSATHPVSVASNKETLYWNTLSLIPRQLEFIYREGEEAFRARARQNENRLRFYDRGLYTLRNLTTASTVRFLLRNFMGRVRNALHYALYHEQWQIRYTLQEDPSSTFWRFKTVLPDTDRYYADPHPIFYDGQWHMFVEDYRYDKNQAHVSVISIDESGEALAARNALTRPYHLSYPFVFTWNDKLWMIPETAKNRSIEFYECVKFPDQWELRRSILEDQYSVDATLHREDGVWYLFANVVENPGASSWDELFLYYNEGDLLTGEWVKHQASPLHSDVTRSRPAGRLFRHQGKLYRPSQDSRRRYGAALAISEIKVLNTREYEEELIDRLHPDWDPALCGMHTFAHRSGLTAIDAVKYIPRSSLWRHAPEWLHRAIRLNHDR